MNVHTVITITMEAVMGRKHQMLFHRSKQMNAHEHNEDTMKTICKVDKLKCKCGAKQSLHLTTLFYNYANPGRFYCNYRAHVERTFESRMLLYE